MAISVTQKNRVILLLVLLVFSFIFAGLPQSLVETNDCNDYEILYRYVSCNNKLAARIISLIRKPRFFIFDLFCQSKILCINFVLALFNRSFLIASIQRLFTILCESFNGGKYKPNYGIAEISLC